MESVSISSIKRDISALVNRVAFGGQRVILTSRGRPKAAIVGLADLERLLALDEKTKSEIRLQELVALDDARALRERILAMTGGLLPDSAEELRELREERDE
jgi:prevent-host-death family protein